MKRAELIEIENALLGSFILEPRSIENLYPIIEGVEFEGVNGHILKAITSLYSDDKPIDMLTVTQELMRTDTLEKAGGAIRIAQLTQNVNQSVGEYHAFLLKEREIKKHVYNVGLKIIGGIEGKKDVLELLADLQEELDQARSGLAKAKVGTSKQAVEDFRKERKEVLESGSDLIGVTTGIPCFDRRLKGYRRGKLTIIAARPGMGKTTLALFSVLAIAMGGNSLAELVACHKSWGFSDFENFFAGVIDKGTGDAVVIFSYEMPATEIVSRLLATLTGLDSEKIANHEYQGTKFQPLLDLAEFFLEQLPLFIEEAGGMSSLDIKAVCQRIDIQSFRVYGKRLKAAFVDYLQLMASPLGNGASREQEVGRNSNNLKVLSKNYAVIALSQLSRAVESRGGDKRPMLSDLRESGSIEQDADIVVFPFRPEYYGVEQDEAGDSILGLCEVIIAKFRGGKVGSELARLDLSKMQFTDWHGVQFRAVDNSPNPYGNPRNFPQADLNNLDLPSNKTPF